MTKLVPLLLNVDQVVAMQGMARLYSLAKEYADNPKVVVFDSDIHSIEIRIQGRCAFHAIQQLPDSAWTIKADDELVPFVRQSLQKNFH